MFNTIVGTLAIGAGAGAGVGAASRYGSGSDQKVRLLAALAPAPQHCIYQLFIWYHLSFHAPPPSFPFIFPLF
jgi:hypothetical protein